MIWTPNGNHNAWVGLFESTYRLCYPSRNTAVRIVDKRPSPEASVPMINSSSEVRANLGNGFCLAQVVRGIDLEDRLRVQEVAIAFLIALSSPRHDRHKLALWITLGHYANEEVLVFHARLLMHHIFELQFEPTPIPIVQSRLLRQAAPCRRA